MAAHAHSLKLIEDPEGMMFEYLHQDEAEFLYEVRRELERALFETCCCCNYYRWCSLHNTNHRISAQYQVPVPFNLRANDTAFDSCTLLWSRQATTQEGIK